MTARRWLAVAVLVAASLWSAGPSGAVSAPEPANVIFIGDSITGSPGCWRAPLWVTLTDLGYRLDMVGPRTQNECGEAVNEVGASWDPDNMGIGGITTIKMWVKLAKDEVLSEYQPDVVVQLLGTNDLVGGASADAVLAQYEKLLELYREQNPSVRVVIGTPPPIDPRGCDGCDSVQSQLAAALPAWTASVSTPASPVFFADLTTGFDVAAFTLDGVHPNEAGNAYLAEAWLFPMELALTAQPAPASASPEPTGTESGRASSMAPVLLASGMVVVALVAGALFVRRRRS